MMGDIQMGQAAVFDCFTFSTLFGPRSMALLLYVALYGCTWNAADERISSAESARIERLEGQLSPRIKVFEHLDYGIRKEVAGSRWNDLFAPKSMVTVPGLVRIGVVLEGYPPMNRIYYPEVEFTAESGGRYGLTWACIPYPFVAIVDPESMGIVAIDSGCPDCQELAGQILSPDSRCDPRLKTGMGPVSMNFFPDGGLDLDKYNAWKVELEKQLYRNWDYAACYRRGGKCERELSRTAAAKYKIQIPE